MGNEKGEMTIMNTDPFTENVSIIVSYTSDTQTPPAFDKGTYAKRFKDDKEIKNNYTAWVNHFESVEIGHCIVTNKGNSTSQKDCYFLIHSIAPIYMAITKDSCCQMLEQCVVNCLETANTLGVENLALPLIACDQDFGFPVKDGVASILKAIKVWIDRQENEEVVCL